MMLLLLFIVAAGSELEARVGTCLIGGTTYSVGTVNPTDPCQVCTVASSSTWSNEPDGTYCGVTQRSVADRGSTGYVCSSGLCANDCFISSTLYTSGTANPSNACQLCTPSSSYSGWSNASDGTACAAGQVCSSGTCVSDCFIGGTLFPAGTVNPSNPCQLCTPGSSTTTWSSEPNGTACGAGEVCSSGSCVADCFIGGTLYTSGAANPSNACQHCTPASSTTTWSNASDGTSCATGVCSSGTCAASTLTVVTDTNATEGGAAGVIALTLSNAPQYYAAIVVSYSLGGTATQGTDYQTIGAVQFPPTCRRGANTSTTRCRTAGLTAYRNVTITAQDNGVIDIPDLFLTFTLTGPVNSSFVVGSPSVATVTILETETTSLTVTSVTNATAKRAIPGSFLLTLSVPLSIDLIVRIVSPLLVPELQISLPFQKVTYSISGTAQPGVDYTIAGLNNTSKIGTATIPAGQSSLTVDVTALLYVPSLTVIMTLGATTPSSQKLTIQPTPATVYITPAGRVSGAPSVAIGCATKSSVRF
jgi:hypothetical protein